MRQYISKRWVTLGTALSVGLVCQVLSAQAPRYSSTRPSPPAAAPQNSQPGYVPIPPNYAPQATRHGPLGLSALAAPPVNYPAMPQSNPPPQVQPVRTQAAIPPGHYAAQPASHTEPQGGLRSRIPNSIFFRRPQPQPAAPPAAQSPAPPGTVVTRQRPPQAAGVPQPVNAAPHVAAAPGQPGLPTPAAMPQGAVVVYMPPDWQPPAEQVAFTPRNATSPEVPDAFWPGDRRNPLGDDEGGGIFRWPKALRGEADDDEPRPRRTARALVSNDNQAGPQADPPADRRKWKALFGSVSGGQASPRPSGKALFAIGRRTSSPRATMPANTPVPRRPAAPVVQTTPAAPAAREPTPAVPVAPRQPASATGPQVDLADAAPVIEDSTNKKLKWRAKGAPKRHTEDAAPATPAARSGPQVAAHMQPVETAVGPATGPTPAAPQAMTPSQSPLPADPSAPTHRSFLTGEPLPQNAAAPESKDVVWTAGPAATKALLPIARTRPTGPTPASPQQYTQPTPARVAAPRKVRQPALFPTMFSKNAPSDVNLTTKPASSADLSEPTPAATRVQVVVRPEDYYKMIDSYYAPPREARSEPVQEATEAKLDAERPTHVSRQQRYEEDLAQLARAQQDRSRAHEPPEDIPALAKPFWAISEMTKLPKFISKFARGNSESPQPPKFRAMYAAPMAHRDPQQREIPDDGPIRAIEADRMYADELTDEEDVPPDVSVTPSSRRRKDNDEPERDAAPDQTEPRKHSELAADDASQPQPGRKSKPAGQSALAGYAEPQQAASDAESDPNATARSSRREEPGQRDRKVVIVRRQSDQLSPGRPKAVRMHKKDGTSVIVYYVGKERPAEEASPSAEPRDATRQGAETAAPETPTTQSTKPLRPKPRDEGDENQRENPLR